MSSRSRLAVLPLWSALAGLACSFVQASPSAAQAAGIDAFVVGEERGRAAPLPPVDDRYWIDEPEMRIGAEREFGDKANLGQESYRLRFRPVTAGQRRHEVALASAEYQRALASRAIATERNLRLRYGVVISYVAAVYVAVELQARVRLARTQLAASRDAGASTRFDPAGLERAAERLNGLERQLGRGQAHLERLQASLALAVDSPAVALAGLAWLITPRQIIGAARAVRRGDSDVRSLAGQHSLTEVQIARAELDMAHREGGFGLKFVELGYDRQNIDSTGVTVAFRLPFRRPSVMAERRRVLDQAEFMHSAEVISAGYETAGRREAMQQLFESWRDADVVRAAIHKRLAEGIKQAEVLFELTEQQIDTDAQLYASHVAMLREYVSLLAIVGALQQVPLRNRLNALQPGESQAHHTGAAGSSSILTGARDGTGDAS